MRTVYRTMTVIAVITVALSLGAVRAAEPPGDRRGRQLCFELADGSVITGIARAKAVTIRVSSGSVLKIPVAALTELSVGLNDRPGLVKRVEALLKGLESADTRQGALRELIALGPAVRPIVSSHAASGVSQRRQAVAQILKAYESWPADHPGMPEAMARPLQPRSRVRADSSTFVASITDDEFRIDTPHGLATLKLDDVHRIRPADAQIVGAAENKIGQWIVKVRDESGLHGVVIGRSLRVQTRYGTILVSFTRIQTAAFAADGKGVRLQCRNYDRIIGSLGPGTTISFKTNTGRVDLPPGKIAALACGDLMLDLGRGARMRLVLIPAGKFPMGSPQDEKDRAVDEGPRREVTISKPFYMGVHAVTQAQWRAVMGTAPWKGNGWARSAGNNPVSYISWDDASKFCAILSKKAGKTVALPTEAQWEYACRAGSKTAYFFGDDASKLGDYAWYKDNAFDKREIYAHAAGQKKPNAWGMYGMHGNVKEWCRDWYAEKFYASAKNVDPENTTKTGVRTLRGGAFHAKASLCRSANRQEENPDRQFSYIGFRVSVYANRAD